MSHLFMYSCLVLFIQLEGVTGLLCYRCYGTTGDTRCYQGNAYIRVKNGVGDRDLITNCTPPFDVMCYTEVYQPNGTVANRIRDCGDGKTFTFSAMTGQDYSNLTSHASDNTTVCGGDKGHRFCLSKCTTDFCNGPQPDASAALGVNKVLLLVVALLLMFR